VVPIEGSLNPRRLGRTGMVVTELSLGGVGFGGLYGPVAEQVATQAVHRAVEVGINYVDTSPLYMESEARLGLALAQMGGKPTNLLLSTKMGTHPARRGDYSAEGARWSVENSLRLMGVDGVDCLLIHDPRSDTELEQALGPGGAVEALERMKAAGKVRSIGLGRREPCCRRRSIQFGTIDAMPMRRQEMRERGR